MYAYGSHNYGLELNLLSIDEGIAGYRDDSLETVKRNQVWRVCRSKRRRWSL